jgi:hypothetical protein
MEDLNKLGNLFDSKVVYFLPAVLGHSAWFQHVPFAYWLLERIKPNSFLEMGVHNGISYFAFCEAIRQQNLETKCIAIDHWAGDSQAGFFSDFIFENFVKKHELYKDFSSYHKNSFEKSMATIDDDSIELVHIDGFHSYAAVQKDFNLALKKIDKTKGIILMHDINEYQISFGVNKFWREIKSKFKTFEFNHGHGLGVVFVGTSIQPTILNLLDEKDAFFSNILRDYFESLGQRIFLYAQNERLNEELTQATKNINHLNENIASLNTNLQNKETAIQNLNDRFQIDLLKITNSFSWKVTSPFRRFSRIVRGIR